MKEIKKLKNKIKLLNVKIDFLQYENKINWKLFNNICNKLNISLSVEQDGVYFEGENISEN